MQSNLASTYQSLGLHEKAMHMKRDVYSGFLRLNGEENESTLRAANNYAGCLKDLERHAEARSLVRKTLPVARRVLGKVHEVTIKLLWACVEAVYEDDNATLDDLREAVNTLEDSARGARRVYGRTHPIVVGTEYHIKHARAALAARETPSPGSRP